MEVPSDNEPSLAELLQCGEFERFKQRLAALPELLEPEDEDEAPLGLAIHSGSVELVRELIGMGCEVNRELDLGETYLVWAMRLRENALPIAKLLLDSGAKMGPCGPEDVTALHWAVVLNAWDVGDLLIRRGADINAADLDESTPLHYAVRAGHPRMVRLLLRAGADRTRQTWGGTAEEIARSRDLRAVLQLFDEFP